MTDSPPLKPVEWMGSTLQDLRRIPGPVQDVVGYALHVAQLGDHPPEAKRLRGELAGILEIADDFDRGTYRAVYTVKLAGAVYVLHVFQKKSTRGIATDIAPLACTPCGINLLLPLLAIDWREPPPFEQPPHPEAPRYTYDGAH